MVAGSCDRYRPLHVYLRNKRSRAIPDLVSLAACFVASMGTETYRIKKKQKSGRQGGVGAGPISSPCCSDCPSVGPHRFGAVLRSLFTSVRRNACSSTSLCRLDMSSPLISPRDTLGLQIFYDIFRASLEGASGIRIRESCNAKIGNQNKTDSTNAFELRTKKTKDRLMARLKIKDLAPVHSSCRLGRSLQRTPSSEVGPLASEEGMVFERLTATVIDIGAVYATSSNLPYTGLTFTSRPSSNLPPGRTRLLIRTNSSRHRI